MKKMIRTFKILLPALLLLQVSLFAQNDNDNSNKKRYEFVQKKIYNKSYNITLSDKLNIDSRFGSVEIHTWAKNEIKVDVQIMVTAKTDEWAKAVLEDIRVEENKLGNQINFKTLFSEDLDKKEGGSKHMDKYKGKDSRQTMEVSYNIYMPADNALNIKNEFGPTILPDFFGEVTLTSKFGSLVTGNLSNVKRIEVEFGKAKFERITGGTVTVKYSKAEFGKLMGKIKLNLEFCNGIVLNLNSGQTDLDVRSSYSNINLKPASDFSTVYDIATNFGNFRNRTPIKFNSENNGRDERGPRFDFKFNGKVGSGASKIKINSSFGNVIIGEAEPDEMDDKEKLKSKKSTS